MTCITLLQVKPRLHFELVENYVFPLYKEVRANLLFRNVRIMKFKIHKRHVPKLNSSDLLLVSICLLEVEYFFLRSFPLPGLHLGFIGHLSLSLSFAFLVSLFIFSIEPQLSLNLPCWYVFKYYLFMIGVCVTYHSLKALSVTVKYLINAFFIFFFMIFF